MRKTFENGIVYEAREGGFDSLYFNEIYIQRTGGRVTRVGFAGMGWNTDTVNTVATKEQKQELIDIATKVFDRVRTLPSAMPIYKARKNMLVGLRSSMIPDSGPNRISLLLENYVLYPPQ